MSVENVFCMKTVKVDYSKNIWKEENCRHSFVCPVVGYISVKKKKKEKKTAILLVEELIKVGKVVSFWPKFDPNFPFISKVWKG